MGEGFVVMQSNDVDIYYYQDEPGNHCDWFIFLSGDVFWYIEINRDKSVFSKCFLCFLGLVPEELENGDTEVCSEDAKLQDLPPCWGLDIVCGKGTDFNYGPWADRQRYRHTLTWM